MNVMLAPRSYRIFLFFFFALIAVIPLLPIIVGGQNVPDSQDLLNHLNMITQAKLALAEGVAMMMPTLKHFYKLHWFGIC
jgi:hypothetical protein